ncbi:MAG TPA: DMT family transporter [Anaerolineales bacterium]|nr:DMT family transporter [Anaerolineales bacterium]
MITMTKPAVHDSLAPPASRVDAAARLAGLVTVVLWGSAFVAIRAAAEAMAPGALALGRVLVSSILLSTLAFVRREPLPPRGDLVRIGAYGILFQGVYSVTLNAAERRVDAGTAAMLIGSGPLLIAILAGIFLHEGFPRRLFAGCVVAFAGSSIIGFATSQAGARAGFGILLLLIAVLAYAAAVVVQKSALRRASAFQVTWLGCLAATLALLPFMPLLVHNIKDAGAAGIGWTLYLGIFPTAIGFATWTFALRRTSAGRMGAMIYLIPPIATLLGWALLGERPPWLAVVGGALCLIGVYLARHD